MTILSALARAYHRMPDAPPYGYSAEKIGFCIVLNPDGSVADVADLRDTEKKRSARALLVPQGKKRTVGIDPNFLWDKSAYVLGITSGEGKRTLQEHAAFRAQHLEWLADVDDPGLVALRLFLTDWTPESFGPPAWSDDLRDQNIVFRLASEYTFLHDRYVARALWLRIGTEGASDPQTCLVTGNSGPVARLHPSIKGVWNAQSSGASLISFNLDAFASYGHEQGDNAPVSEGAAFAYTTALNRLLADNLRRVQIGDASTVFWADASDPDLATEAEGLAGVMLGRVEPTGGDEKIAEQKIIDKLAMMRDGKPLAVIAPRLAQGVRFYVLGLAPNAARLSVRFWWQGNFGDLAGNYALWLRDMHLEPAPDRPVFSIRATALRSAPAERRNGKLHFDGDRVSTLLAGELTRAILTGGRFPRALLSLLLLRIRGDQELDRVRIALIKALIVRDMRLDRRLPLRPDGTPMEDYLMTADPMDPNPARHLGRLFALIERAQLAALGSEINATVKDKFLGAAASTPGRVFGQLLENAERHHLKRLRNGHSDAKWIKDPDHARAVGAGLNREIGQIWAEIGAAVPQQHSTEEQGLFLVGYYQERYRKRPGATDDTPEAETATTTPDNEE